MEPRLIVPKALQPGSNEAVVRYLWKVTPEGSLASHTLRRERKGLVTLQLPSCRRGAQLSNIAVR